MLVERTLKVILDLDVEKEPEDVGAVIEDIFSMGMAASQDIEDPVIEVIDGYSTEILDK